MGVLLYCGYISCLCACNASHPRDTSECPWNLQHLNMKAKVGRGSKSYLACLLPHHRPNTMPPFTNRTYSLSTPAALLAPSSKRLCPLAFGSGKLRTGHSRAKQKRSAQPVYMANFLSRLFGGGNSTNEKAEVRSSFAVKHTSSVCAKLFCRLYIHSEQLYVKQLQVKLTQMKEATV